MSPQQRHITGTDLNRSTMGSSTLSSIPTIFKGVTYSPLGAALALGGAAWGASRLAYPLLSRLGKAMVSNTSAGQDVSDEELEEELNGENSLFKKWAPLAIGGLTTAAFLAGQYNPKLGFGENLKKYVLPWNKRASYVQVPMRKEATEMFNWDINDQTYLDFGKLIPIRTANEIILNDPHTEVYQKGNALSVIQDASGGRNVGSVSAGAVFDSALNNIQNNLTVAGVANAAVKGIVGYGIAKAFTNTIGNMVGMPQDLRNAIVNTGMVSGIIKGMIQ